MSDYWKESVEIALLEMGVKLTDEQIDELANAIEISSENYGMARGHDVIPSPSESPKDQKITGLKKEIADLKSDIEIFRRSVARRRNVAPDQVYLERLGPGRGAVMIDQ